MVNHGFFLKKTGSWDGPPRSQENLYYPTSLWKKNWVSKGRAFDIHRIYTY
jgi:hypothetical protein